MVGGIVPAKDRYDFKMLFIYYIQVSSMHTSKAIAPHRLLAPKAEMAQDSIAKPTLRLPHTKIGRLKQEKETHETIKSCRKCENITSFTGFLASSLKQDKICLRINAKTVKPDTTSKAGIECTSLGLRVSAEMAAGGREVKYWPLFPI